MNNKGFTLLELMIAVAIVGILTAIAYPSYQAYLQDARRADAQANLLEMAQWMEREFTVNGTYQNASGAAPSLPIDTSPKDSDDTFYELSVVTPNSSSFTLTATPSNAQVGDPCGNMTVNQTGAKTAGDNGCW